MPTPSPTFVESLEPRLFLAAQPTSPTPAHRVVAYFTDRYYTKFFRNIDFTAITQLNYFALGFASNGDLVNPGNGFDAHLDTVVAAAHKAGDRVSITVGPRSFNNIVSSATASANFSNKIIQYAVAHHLDGIDLDWEPKPVAKYVTMYGTLIANLRTLTSARGMTLSAAVFPPGTANTFDIPASAANNLDWISVMDYALHPGDHANFTETMAVMNAWANYGVSKSKLIMGIPFYGMSKDPKYAGQEWGYYDILRLHHDNAGVYPDPAADVVDGWYLNSPATVAAKTTYAFDNGFGGVMLWQLGLDHYDTEGNYDQWSLLPAVKQAAQPNVAFSKSVTGSITGQVFSDVNGNGVRESTEAGFTGWTVYLDLNNSKTNDAGDIVTTTTASAYRFAGLAPGTYTVRIASRGGYLPTSPSTSSMIVTVGAGATSSGINFGQAHVASISGVVFSDLNKNALQETAEPGLGSWRLFIDSNNNGLRDASEASVLTASTGKFNFYNLLPGTYVIRAVQMAGWSQTTPASGLAQSISVMAFDVKTGVMFGERKI